MYEHKFHYFGVKSPTELGHYLYGETIRYSIYENNCPYLPMKLHCLDAGLLHNIPDIPGNGRIFHIGGWTVLTFWDRSGDKRAASNSTLMVKENIFDLEKLSELFVKQYPELFERFNFNIVLHQAERALMKDCNWKPSIIDPNAPLFLLHKNR